MSDGDEHEQGEDEQGFVRDTNPAKPINMALLQMQSDLLKRSGDAMSAQAGFLSAIDALAYCWHAMVQQQRGRPLEEKCDGRCVTLMMENLAQSVGKAVHFEFLPLSELLNVAMALVIGVSYATETTAQEIAYDLTSRVEHMPLEDMQTGFDRWLQLESVEMAAEEIADGGLEHLLRDIEENGA